MNIDDLLERILQVDPGEVTCLLVAAKALLREAGWKKIVNELLVPYFKQKNVSPQDKDVIIETVQRIIEVGAVDSLSLKDTVTYYVD